MLLSAFPQIRCYYYNLKPVDFSKWIVFSLFFSIICQPLSLNSLAAPSDAEAKAPGGFKPQKNVGQVKESLAQVPLYFETNNGQVSRRIKFISRSGGRTLFLSNNEAILSDPKISTLRIHTREDLLERHLPSRQNKREKGTAVSSRPAQPFKLKFLHSNLAASAEGMQLLPSMSNYLIGSDPKGWQTNVAHYAKVKFNQIYPGVDLVYYGNQRQFEYDLVVEAGANPSLIKLKLEGVPKLRLNLNGD